MTKILKGDLVVKALNEKMKNDIEHIAARGVSPTLAILRVGDRPDDISYERNVIRRSETVGVSVKSIVLPEDIGHDSLLENIQALNDDNGIHGVLMFRPLPSHLNERDACAALVPSKDIDGITMQSLAGVFSGSGEGFAPCTAQAVLEILDFYDIDCTSKNVVIVGRSLVVGKPAAMMLIGRNATVTICHTKTVDLSGITSKADIVIVATGQAEGLTSEHFCPGQIVIDVGINWNEAKGKLCGDVKFEDAEPIVAAITPVPGGVGTVTTSVLLSNVVRAAKKVVFP